MRNISLCALLLACLVAPLSAQNIVTIGDGTDTNGTTTYPAPLGNYYESARHQMIVLASELTAAGVGMGDINAIGFDVDSAGTSGLHEAWTISLGTTTASDLSAGYEVGLVAVTTPVDYTPVDGNNVFTLNAPFAWDGTSNLVIETCFDSSVTAGFTDNAIHNRTDVGFAATVYRRADGSSQCGSTLITGTSNLRANIVLDVSNFTPAVPDWQVNQPEATCTINGVTGTDSTLAEVTICTNETAALDITTTLTASPFDLVVWQGLPLDSTATGLVTMDNQVIHFDSSSPFFLFFVGGASFNFTTNFADYVLPFPFNFSTPFTAQAGLQAFHIDPSGAGGDFVRMSQPTSLTITDGETVDLGNGDDQVTELVFDSAPLCGPATVDFYGTSYTNCFAAANGRVSFIAGDGDFSVTLGEALDDTPFVGVWQDLAPQYGGTWEAVSTGTSVNISWNNIEYWRGATDPVNPMATYSVDFFATGAVALNLTNLPVGTADAFLGMSPGDDDLTGTTPNPATDAGPTAFIPGGFNTGPVMGRDMIYNFGTQGTLSPGVGTIIFTPNGAGNYNWASY